MKDIASHLMDIVQNSITAEASRIDIILNVDNLDDRLSLEIKDDGKGMDRDMLKSVTNPFTTTRTTRRVGLGIPLFKEGAERTGGSFSIDSEVGIGTDVIAEYVLSNIDRPPLGDFSGVCSTLIICNSDIDFKIIVASQGKEYDIDTVEMKAMLDGIPFSNPDVSKFIIDNIKEGLDDILGGNFE